MDDIISFLDCCSSDTLRQINEAPAKQDSSNSQMGLLGRSLKMQRLRGDIIKIARLKAPVLISGESGTGKELVAKGIHSVAYRRKNRGFVALNCGALPDTLVEDIFFGHEKGAYTGAPSLRKGVFERANGGTLFLDEIGELPLNQQAALLRVIETGRFCRLGGESEISTDFRLVCATNRDLADQVASGRFRMDLYHRIAILTLHTPSLRERPSDIADIAEQFFRQTRDELGNKRLSPLALGILKSLKWPGNVRELKNVLYRSSAFNNDKIIRSCDLKLEIEDEKSIIAESSKDMKLMADLLNVPHLNIMRLVEKHAGNVTAAARELGIARTTLRDRLRKAETKVVVNECA